MTTTTDSSTGESTSEAVRDTRVLIVGAGVSGMTVAIALQRAGVPDHEVLIVDAGSEVGGTWRDNTTPAARATCHRSSTRSRSRRIRIGRASSPVSPRSRSTCGAWRGGSGSIDASSSALRRARALGRGRSAVARGDERWHDPRAVRRCGGRSAVRAEAAGGAWSGGLLGVRRSTRRGGITPSSWRGRTWWSSAAARRRSRSSR